MWGLKEGSDSPQPSRGRSSSVSSWAARPPQLPLHLERVRRALRRRLRRRCPRLPLGWPSSGPCRRLSPPCGPPSSLLSRGSHRLSSGHLPVCSDGARQRLPKRALPNFLGSFNRAEKRSTRARSGELTSASALPASRCAGAVAVGASGYLVPAVRPVIEPCAADALTVSCGLAPRRFACCGRLRQLVGDSSGASGSTAAAVRSRLPIVAGRSGCRVKRRLVASGAVHSGEPSGEDPGGERDARRGEAAPATRRINRQYKIALDWSLLLTVICP